MSSRPAEREIVIDLRNIRKIYQMGTVDIHALRGVSLHIYRGEFVSIMGPSGSGKSTLLQILGALDQPTNGEYYLDGVDIAKLNTRQLAFIRNHKIGFVFQSFNLLRRTRAVRQVELPLIYARVQRRFNQARTALEAVGLGKRLNHRPNELSGGQQQRVAIARAVVSGPAIILADEPTGNLDSKSGLEILKLFQEMNRSQGMTIIIVTHDLFVARHADRIITLRDGAIVTDRAVPNPIRAGSVEQLSEVVQLDDGAPEPSFVKRQELDE